MHMHAYHNHTQRTHNTIKHTSQLLHFYPYTNKCTYIGVICDVPMEALVEASGAAEDVDG